MGKLANDDSALFGEGRFMSGGEEAFNLAGDLGSGGFLEPDFQIRGDGFEVISGVKIYYPEAEGYLAHKKALLAAFTAKIEAMTDAWLTLFRQPAPAFKKGEAAGGAAFPSALGRGLDGAACSLARLGQTEEPGDAVSLARPEKTGGQASAAHAEEADASPRAAAASPAVNPEDREITYEAVPFSGGAEKRAAEGRSYRRNEHEGPRRSVPRDTRGGMGRKLKPRFRNWLRAEWRKAQVRPAWGPDSARLIYAALASALASGAGVVRPSRKASHLRRMAARAGALYASPNTSGV